VFEDETTRRKGKSDFQCGKVLTVSSLTLRRANYRSR
jgi:hypothetical protein